MLVLIFSSQVNSKEIIGLYEYYWVEDKLCNNGFEDKSSKNYIKSQVIKKKLGFIDYSGDWLYNVNYCLIIKNNKEKYIVKRLLNKFNASAFYIIFSSDNAYGVYGRYVNSRWVLDRAFYKKNDKNLLKMLDSYLLKIKWIE